MKISELITELEKVKAKRGDLPVAIEWDSRCAGTRDFEVLFSHGEVVLAEAPRRISTWHSQPAKGFPEF